MSEFYLVSSEDAGKKLFSKLQNAVDWAKTHKECKFKNFTLGDTPEPNKRLVWIACRWDKEQQNSMRWYFTTKEKTEAFIKIDKKNMENAHPAYFARGSWVWSSRTQPQNPMD